MKNEKPLDSKKLSVVITCHGSADDLSVSLGSLLTQRRYTDNGKVLFSAAERIAAPHEIIICSDGKYEGPKIERKEAYPDNFQPRIQIIECPQKGGVGHHTRGPGIEAATGDFIVLTNADNYFVAGWLYLLSCEITFVEHLGLVWWDVCSNAWNWKSRGAVKLRGYIDLSSVAVRSEIAKEIGFPYRNYDGDFDYIKDCRRLCMQKGYGCSYLPYTLGVHN